MELNQDPYQMAGLLLKHLRGETSTVEEAAITAWLDADPHNREFLERLETGEGLTAELDFFSESNGKAEAWRHIQSAVHPKVRRLWPRIAAAASILVACSVGGYFVLHHQRPQNQLAQTQPHDIAPGHNQATLTLANGKKIILTKGLNGLLATQGKTAINASGNTIVYDATKADQLVSYNTLSTARGEQSPYPLVLPDGSKVWLNAESSITFPTAFTGSERIVKVTGEAYFEVVHNAKQPFKVNANGQTIEDIGTAFDVNSYDNEPSRQTTLVSGAIKVNGILLKPGQQLNGKTVTDADLEETLAWKNGLFSFHDAPLSAVVRQLERWYQVDIHTENLPDVHFNGGISRNTNISNVLHMLAVTGNIQYKVEGHEVTLSKTKP